jgi:hypothetical protein
VEVGRRIAGNANMFHLIKGNPGRFQAVIYRQCRKAGTMLFSIETFFLNCGNELAIFDDCRRGITVIRVYPQDVQTKDSLTYRLVYVEMV